MNKLEQAARQALEALDKLKRNLHGSDLWEKHSDAKEAINALREALAEPELNLNCKSVQKRLATVWGYVKAEQAEQKPVAWALTSENGEVLDCISHTYKVTQPCTVDYDEPLYAAPVRTKDLTDDEIAKIAFVDKVPLSTKSLARAVIAAYKEKNK